MKIGHYLAVCILLIACCFSIGCEEIQNTLIISGDPYKNLPEIGQSAELAPGRYILRHLGVADREYRKVEIVAQIGDPAYCDPSDTFESTLLMIRLEPDDFGHVTYIQLGDEIVIEIDEKIRVYEEQRPTYTCDVLKTGFYTYHVYSGRVIENFTQPEDVFEYEIDPENPDAIVGSDQVSIETELKYPVFETAQAAIDDGTVQIIISNIFSWIYSNCPSAGRYYNRVGSSREYTLYFTHRKDREAFIGYLYRFFPLRPDFEFVWSLDRAVHVFEETNYFYLYFDNKHPVIGRGNCPPTIDLLD